MGRIFSVNIFVVPFFLLAFLTSIGVDAKPKLSWGAESLDAEVLNGTVVVQNVSFVSTTTIEELSFKIGDDCEDESICSLRPELGSLIEVVQLTPGPVVADTEVQLAVIFSISTDVPDGEYAGTLHVRDGNRTIARPLTIRLAVYSGSASIIPEGITTPSIDRISLDPYEDIQYVKDAAEIIVDESADISEIKSLLSSVGGVFEGELRELNLYQIGFPGVHSPEVLDYLIEQLGSSPVVKNASRITLADARFAPPNDLEYSEDDWDESFPFDNINSPAYALEVSKFLSAWELAYEQVSPENAADVRVAIVDQGFDRNHEDLSRNINKTLSSAWLGLGDHGTKVTGVVGAVANNKIGIAGALWNADLVLRHMALNTTTHAVDEMVFSIKNGAKIINYSNGMTYPENPPLWLELSKSLNNTKFRDLLNYCDKETKTCASDVLFVFAVGNDGDNGTKISEDFKNDLPSSLSLEYSNVVSVGAALIGINYTDRLSQGGDINVAAPSQIWSTQSGNKKYDSFNGTSYAAPMVSGLGGLVLTRNPGLTPSQVKSIIIAGSCIASDSRKIGDENYYTINAFESVKLADNPDAAKDACDEASAISARIVGSFTANVTLTWIVNPDGSRSSNIPTPNGIARGDQLQFEIEYETGGPSGTQRPNSTFYSFSSQLPAILRLRASNGQQTLAQGVSSWITMDHNRIIDSLYYSYFFIQTVGASFPGYETGTEHLNMEIGLIGAPQPNQMLKSEKLPTSLADVDLSLANILRIQFSSRNPRTPGTFGFEADIDLNSFTLNEQQ